MLLLFQFKIWVHFSDSQAELGDFFEKRHKKAQKAQKLLF